MAGNFVPILSHSAGEEVFPDLLPGRIWWKIIAVERWEIH
jgi:hypothetical protein